MTRYQIVEAKAYHCGQMARILRDEHKKALSILEVNTHKELRACFDESTFRKAWLIDGRLAAVGGVTGPALSSDGTVWLAMSQEAHKHPREILRESRRQLREISLVKNSLLTLILLRDETSFRFATHLGFHVSPLKTEVFDAALMTYETREAISA